MRKILLLLVLVALVAIVAAQYGSRRRTGLQTQRRRSSGEVGQRRRSFSSRRRSMPSKRSIDESEDIAEFLENEVEGQIKGVETVEEEINEILSAMKYEQEEQVSISDKDTEDLYQDLVKELEG